MHQHSHFLLMMFIAFNQYLQYKSKCKHSKMNIIIVQILNDLVNDSSFELMSSSITRPDTSGHGDDRREGGGTGPGHVRI